MITLINTLSTNQATIQETAQALRPYQEDAILNIRLAWESEKIPLAVMATGLGKTTVFSELLVREINPNTQRALVFAHTKELVDQPYERIVNQFGSRLQDYYGPHFAPGAGIVMADRNDAAARIIVATRQSLHPRRLKEILQHGPIDLVVYDEAHHYAPDTTAHTILTTLRDHNPDIKIVGFTATPRRSDRKALGALFTSICFDYGILSGIKDGWLVAPTQIRVRTGIDTGKVKTSNGDFTQDQLMAVLDANNWTDLAVSAYKTHILEANRPCLAFFPGVQESIRFTAALRSEGIPAAHIDANTPKPERAEILRDYKAGKVKIVSNCAVLTEGFDAAHTSAILMARPTRSETLLTQIIGRGLRLYPDKHDCLVVNLTVADTKVLEIGTLLGKMITCHACEAQFHKGFKNCPHCGAPAPVEGTRTKTCPACDAEVPVWCQVCPECAHVFLRQDIQDEGSRDRGTGLVEEIVSLFSSLVAAWHKGSDDEYFSCAAGIDNGTLVIAPPSYDEGMATRLRARLMRGQALLPTIDAELKADLIEQIGQVQRQVRRIDHYSLYFVPPQQKDAISGRPLAEARQFPVEFVRANQDLASLMTEADSEILRRAGDQAKYAKRTADWRDREASPGQRSYLKQLGVRNLPDNLTKGAAAELITHSLAVRRIKIWIEEDILPEAESEKVALETA